MTQLSKPYKTKQNHVNRPTYIEIMLEHDGWHEQRDFSEL